MRTLDEGTVRIDNDPTGVRITGYCAFGDNRNFKAGLGIVMAMGSMISYFGVMIRLSILVSTTTCGFSMDGKDDLHLPT